MVPSYVDYCAQVKTHDFTELDHLVDIFGDTAVATLRFDPPLNATCARWSRSLPKLGNTQVDMDNDERQATFLLAEYDQISGSIAGNNVNINNGFRLFFTLVAAGVAAVMLGFSKDAAPSQILLFSATFSSFLLVFSALGSIVLMQNQLGLLRRLAAINAIRRYFLDLVPRNARYFRLPVSIWVPKLHRLSSKAGVVFAVFLVIVFSATVGVAWSLYIWGSRPAAVLIGIVAAASATALQLVALRRLEEAARSGQAGESPVPRLEESA